MQIGWEAKPDQSSRGEKTLSHYQKARRICGGKTEEASAVSVGIVQKQEIFQKKGRAGEKKKRQGLLRKRKALIVPEGDGFSPRIRKTANDLINSA